MGNRDHCYGFPSIVTLYFFFLVSFDLHILASSTLNNHCRKDERDVLLELKNEFSTNATSLSRWDNNTDCCSWEGVTCYAKSGQVISLDLNYNVLNSSLKPNSALFKFQHLHFLNLEGCNLYGKLPSSIGNLSSCLTELYLEDNQFVGEVPSSIGNLDKLTFLRLYGNKFTGNIPTSFANFTKMSELDISQNQFTGNFPLITLPNLTSLSYLYLSSNHFNSPLPSDMTRFQSLKYFIAYENSLSGSIPASLFTIPSLLWVYLEENQFKGHIDFWNTSSSSSNLQYLYLGSNKLDGPIPESISKFHSLEIIDLSHNHFTGPIPESISKLDLVILDLSYNNLEGQVPSFLWRMEHVTLSHNSFTSFEESSQFHNDTRILALDLSSNSLRGPFPDWICKLTSLYVLDLSNNHLNGTIPWCLNLTSDLTKLVLHNNSLTGVLPDIFLNATRLRILDVSRNQLQGKLPKSLINCRDVELLNVGRNRIKDEFPSWLGSLPLLRVLFLRSNEFYGLLHQPDMSIGFQNLSVIDISYNDFNGNLPPYFFASWTAMTRLFNVDQFPLIEDSYNISYAKGYYSFRYNNTMEMVNKGVEMEFERFRGDFRAIDISGNMFCGEIPESIGLLKELHLLNLSGNAFTGNISPSLANLTNLEALDLSQNKLSGHIPRELGSLSFLAIINFSHNDLEGSVPRSTQFQRQNCSSFMDNPKLYGLEDICGETHVPNPPSSSQQSQELSEPEEQVFNWIAAAIAYGPGVFWGMVIGHIYASHKRRTLH